MDSKPRNTPFPADLVKIGTAIAVTCDDCDIVVHWEWHLTAEEAEERRAQHVADHRNGKIPSRNHYMGN